MVEKWERVLEGWGWGGGVRKRGFYKGLIWLFDWLSLRWGTLFRLFDLFFDGSSFFDTSMPSNKVILRYYYSTACISLLKDCDRIAFLFLSVNILFFILG
jgi:hypothetical protein